MYIPQAFAETDREKLLDFIEAHSFGLLVSRSSGQLFASHLPLLVRRERDGAQLLGHMARANPQWQDLAGQDALAVFSGPHAYISPRWYESDNVVPTWNYLAVHVRGKCQVVDDASTAAIVQDYVSTYERPDAQGPWSIDPASGFFQKLVKMIVGFRIDIEQLEGKWKLGQNQTAERRTNVARHLAASKDAEAREIGRLMAATLADAGL
jgi:transcriptional regulator